MSVRINGVLVGNDCYPNNERIFKDVVNPNRCDFVIEMVYETDIDIFNMMMCKKRIDDLPDPHGYHCRKYVKLIMNYVPYSRMDRQIEGYMFSLKYFCELINSLKFDYVQITDPHSDITPTMLNNCVVMEPYANINQIMTKYEMIHSILYPDMGAFTRYAEFKPIKDVPKFYAMKKRNLNTGEIVSYDLIDPPALVGKTVLIADDLCCKGRTFLEAGKLLKDKGASRVILYVTHCEQSIFKGNLLNTNYVDHIYTTNSILQTSGHTKITILEQEESA